MNRYASVYFNMPGKESADYEKALIMELESNKIIELEPGDLDKMYEEDKKNNGGCQTNVVLHDRRERRIFKSIMDDSLYKDNPYIEWKITMRPQGDEFRDFVKKTKEKRKNGKRETV